MIGLGTKGANDVVTKPQPPAFDPHDVAESNATGYPETYRTEAQRRYNRRLGDHAGLKNFGVNMTRILPGGRSSQRHAHTRQDEFVYVLEGEVVLETNAGAQTLRAGMCAGFPAGSADAHCFVNRSGAEVLLLVVGDRTPGDGVGYPDIDLEARVDADGKYRFFHKDGTPY